MPSVVVQALHGLVGLAKGSAPESHLFPRDSGVLWPSLPSGFPHISLRGLGLSGRGGPHPRAEHVAGSNNNNNAVTVSLASQSPSTAHHA